MSRLTRDGTAEPVSRDQILRHARGQGNTIFPVQLTTSRIGNFTRLIYTLLYVMTIHTYIDYILTFPRFPLRKKEHKSYFGKNRTHDFRTSRCAGYLLDHSDCSYPETLTNMFRFFCNITQG